MHAEHDLSTISLFLDVDGTLIDLAPRPTDVVVPASLIADLERAKARLDGALALVSGRTISDLDRLFHPLRLKASGVHGAEFRLSAEGPIETARVAPLPAEAWADLVLRLNRFPGTLAENKVFSYAVHYRAVPDVAPALEMELETFVADHDTLDLRIMGGHSVFEIKPPGINKGAAIERFLATPLFAGRKPVFFGDDVTDLPGFATVLAHGGYAYGVARGEAGLSGTFADPQAVRQWLADVTVKEVCTA
jgi:trehalose 6-phosphate phosphatase